MKRPSAKAVPPPPVQAAIATNGPEGLFLYVPVLCLALAFLWAWGASAHPGMMPGRAAQGLLIIGCLGLVARPSRLRWSWRSPVPWLAAAVLWQGIALAGWCPAQEPGLVWLLERTAALFTAVAVACWCRDRPAPALLTGLAGAGAGVLLLSAATQPPVAGGWPSGPDLPFGNPNFNVGAAVPLLGLALPFITRPSAAGRWPAVTITLLGTAAAMVLGSGIVTGDGARAAWLGLGAIAGLWLLLRLPARWHGWGAAAGAVAVGGTLVLLVADVIALPDHSPSSNYRLALWRTAWEAILQAPLAGTGPGSALVVLQEQLASPIAWLWVPSYAEHAHNEYLNTLIDGGAINAALLLAGLLLTLVPLWRRRGEPVAQGLLLAWAGVLTQALVESHLSQPGPLLLLAMLAGVTWATTGEPVAIPLGGSRVGTGVARPGVAAALPLTLAGLLAAAASSAMALREFTDGGSPTMIEVRAERRMEAVRRELRQDLSADIAEGVRRRVGDLDRWLSLEAVERAKARDLAGAERLVIRQLARLPVDPAAVDLGLRLRDRHRQRNEACPELEDALHAARDRGQALLELVPETDKARKFRVFLLGLYPRI